MRRRCLGCQTLITSGSRCRTCRAEQRSKYAGEWPTHSREAIAHHLATIGPICPGWARQAHTVTPTDLTLDHHVGVLCRACNSRKRAMHDKRG